MGPTASGKTEAAAKLYELIPSELISVDAAQIYRGMNIGTAKPNDEFLDRYPHHLINIRDINETYSAANFCQDASQAVDKITDQNKLPIFVGGTMFYFSAFENGLSDLPSTDMNIRAEIQQEIQQKGLNYIYQKLVSVDPDIQQRLSATDTQRVQRAMEIYRITGSPPSQEISKLRKRNSQVPIIKIVLFTGNRKTLHRRIESRFETMIEMGLIDEVKSLIESVSHPAQLASMRCVGYRQVLDYLTGDISRSQMIKNGVAATRQLAKRQLTWLRNQTNVVWFDTENQDIGDAIIQYLRAHP